jgi:acyl-CoA reductase-like NAD-dependent aldehyde dehydrogenase
VTSELVRCPEQFYIGGEWVSPSTASTVDVIDSATGELFLRVAQAQEADMVRAVAAAREAFDRGPWPKLTHAECAGYLRALADGIAARANDLRGARESTCTGVDRRPRRHDR